MRSSVLLVLVLVLQGLSSLSSLAQSLDSALAFYPMQQGNYWLYDFRKVTVSHYYMSVQIRGDTTMPNQKTYSVFVQTNLSNHTDSSFYKRVDSSTACVYQWDPVRLKEWRMDSLRVTPPGIIFIESRPIYCYDMSPDTVLGIATVSKYFSSFTFQPQYRLSYGLGLVFQFLDDRFWGEYTTLVYARIKGVEYGTAASVPDAAAVPAHYELVQNYPNPFNPSTIISYSVPRSANVSLAIFNTLGQKVASLVNRREEEGYHQVIWNATNVPSGIYFYRLQAGEYVETKKMILLK